MPKGYNMKRKWLFSLLVVLLVLPLIAGCGRKGSPLPPAGEKNTYPRSYPSQ
jgi:predicted small lipoprotein YifL